jgi:hypothetical protein
MEIPTSTFLNLPHNFLSNVFGIVGYLFDNFKEILIIVFGFIAFFALVSLLLSFFKKD